MIEYDQKTRIWKFQFDISDEITIEMPEKAVILHVACQVREEAGGAISYKMQIPTLWAKCSTTAPMEKRTFHIVGTGRPMPVNAAYYVATFMMPPFVWHMFESNHGSDEDG